MAVGKPKIVRSDHQAVPVAPSQPEQEETEAGPMALAPEPVAVNEEINAQTMPSQAKEAARPRLGSSDAELDDVVNF